MTTVNLEYPDLRIVPIGRIIPHELHDEQRARPLLNRIRSEGVLKSPILVTPLDSEEGEPAFVILDGTNRSIALDMLGIGDLLVQVVPYKEPHVKLLTWNHALCGIDEERIEKILSETKGLSVRRSTLQEATDSFKTREIIAYCRFDDERALCMSGSGDDLASRAQYLQGIVGSYIRECEVNRVRSDSFTQLKDIYHNIAAIMIFPSFTPEEILDLVRLGLRVPAGITRHLINGRALRINYSLNELGSAENLDEKNAKLMRWMKEKFANKEARFYGEPTYLFDE